MCTPSGSSSKQTVHHAGKTIATYPEVATSVTTGNYNVVINDDWMARGTRRVISNLWEGRFRAFEAGECPGGWGIGVSLGTKQASKLKACGGISRSKRQRSGRVEGGKTGPGRFVGDLRDLKLVKEEEEEEEEEEREEERETEEGARKMRAGRGEERRGQARPFHCHRLIGEMELGSGAVGPLSPWSLERISLASNRRRWSSRGQRSKKEAPLSVLPSPWIPTSPTRKTGREVDQDGDVDGGRRET